MNSDIQEIHEYLTKIYNNAELLFKKVQNKYNEADLSSFTNHYIMINNKMEHQKYFMPVITVNRIGDICFNLDGISFEFVLKKAELIDLDLDYLIKNYASINIYSQNDCLKDFYTKGNTVNQVIDKILNSEENNFGISFDCDNNNFDMIITNFIDLSNI